MFVRCNWILLLLWYTEQHDCTRLDVILIISTKNMSNRSLIQTVLIKLVLCSVWISYVADRRQVWKRRYMSMTLIKVILIPPGQSCLVFVYFENLWEVNTPCAQRLRQTTGVWYQAELKLCQHIQSSGLTLQRPLVVSYLRHRHTVIYITHTQTHKNHILLFFSSCILIIVGLVCSLWRLESTD